MKKLFLITLACLLIAGCGKTKEEKEEILYDSLEKAYVAVFSAEGAGLPVFEEQKIEIDGETWYKVALSEYANIEKLLAYAEDVYSKDISEELSEKLTTKYRQSNGDLYTPSKGQCTLDYFLTETTKDEIKANVKIKRIRSKKITFEYKNKEFSAKLDGDNYVFDKQIFECN